MQENTIENLKSEFENGQILLIDKPYKWTSFDVVNKIKWNIKNSLKIKKIKIGHAGTLDPLATGLLIICTGRKTKIIEQIQNQPKEYIATISLGNTTPSYDLETPINQTWSVENIKEIDIIAALEKQKGTIMQEPPIYSAKWIQGKRAYELARDGKTNKLNPVEIKIYKNELLQFSKNEIIIKVECSKGTYIRSLARDIGIELNNGAYLKALQRTSIGQYKIENAQTIDNFCQNLSEKTIKL